MWNIAEIRGAPSLELFSELVELLQDAVKSGASIGFLAPLSTADARNYWLAVLGEVARGERVILLARDGTSIIGCAQLVLTVRANARHRAEIQNPSCTHSGKAKGSAEHCSMRSKRWRPAKAERCSSRMRAKAAMANGSLRGRAIPVLGASHATNAAPMVISTRQ